ncbi:hypothetical protein QCA50_000614 [Cerrena zonata]|uniref:DNA 3'-5' helicase n=1 Tax=Cerrena zonata TaxID=2478898 RepID=A0AAW0GX34_9APHY
MSSTQAISPISTTTRNTAINQDLESILRQACQVPAVRDFQLKHAADLVNGRDLFLVISPGMGKTLVIHAPLLVAHHRKESGIALIIVPTKLLAEQQADVATKRGLFALAINEDTVQDAYYKGRNLFQELVKASGIRAAIMSPQMLQSSNLSSLIDDVTFRALVRWFLIDEIHLADEDSGDWKAAYLPLKYMRQRLRPSTIWAGFTGTATRSATTRITSALGFPHDYVNARYSVDRPQIKYIVRFLQYSISTNDFFDIAFLIPPTASSSDDIPRTFIFCESIELGWRVMTFLTSLLPPTFPNRKEVVLLYNALMPKSYRQRFMKEIVGGPSLRIGVCTETCTYGLDAPNIRRVVTFTLAPSHEALKQRLSRGGRDGLPAEAYSFAPTWVRDVPPQSIKTAQAREDAERRAKLPSVVRQWYNSSPSFCSRRADLEYFDEEMGLPREVCCSSHQPEPEQSEHAALNSYWHEKFLDARVGSEVRVPLPRSDGTYKPLEPGMRESLLAMLHTWRRHTWMRIRGHRLDMLASQFLPASILTRVVEKAHICTTLENLRAVMGWLHFDVHGSSLFAFLKEVLEGFGDILKERVKEEDGDDSEGDRESKEATLALPSLRVRILPPATQSNTMVPAKRVRSDSVMNQGQHSEKRTARVI